MPMDLHGKHIILGSNSPRRRELLKGLDIDFVEVIIVIVLQAKAGDMVIQVKAEDIAHQVKVETIIHQVKAEDIAHQVKVEVLAIQAKVEKKVNHILTIIQKLILVI